jgi:hypothetical protein
MPDFSQPSSDGALPDDFVEWQWGVTYTLRPPDGPPLSRGREYLITVSVRKMSPDSRRFQTFGPIYHHALRIATARGEELAAAAGHPPLHRRIVSHGWRSVDVGPKHFATAFVMIGLLWPVEGKPVPAGEPVPGDHELERDGGATLDMLQRDTPQRAPEVYVEFDHRDEMSSHRRIMTLSYGERVAPSERFSFEPSVARAEHRAKFHRRLLVGETAAAHDPLRVVRREWFMIRETNLATVHIYFEV